MSKYRLEYREAGRRRWRVIWHSNDPFAGGDCNLYRTFRDRAAAERWMEKKEPTGREAWAWKPAPEKPQPRLPGPERFNW